MKFEIFKSTKNGQYYFRLRAADGRILLRSEGYVSKQGAQRGVGAVQRNGGDVTKYKKKIISKNSFYFTLQANNNRIIAISTQYNLQKQLESNIDQLMFYFKKQR